MFSPESVEKIAEVIAIQFTGVSLINCVPERATKYRYVAQAAIAAIESTPEMLALRDFEQAYVNWATSDAGGQAEGQFFIDLVEAYDAVEKSRQVQRELAKLSGVGE